MRAFDHARTDGLSDLAFHRCSFDPKQDITKPAPHPLPPSLDRAIVKRRAEFLAGRMAASAALQDLTGTRPDIGIRNDRSPDWPAGIVGSISHTQGLAAAMVGLSDIYAGIGLDCEQIVSLKRAELMQSRIFTAQELSHQPSHITFETFFSLAFSAKESFFKAFYPQAGRNMGFMTARLDEMQQNHLILTETDMRRPQSLKVYYEIEDGFVTTLTVRRQPA